MKTQNVFGVYHHVSLYSFPKQFFVNLLQHLPGDPACNSTSYSNLIMLSCCLAIRSLSSPNS